MKIKKGDNVIVIKGKDRSKSGKVVKVFPMGKLLTIEGINLHQKTIRPKNTNEKGQLVKLPKPIPVSNIMIVCPACGKPSRLGLRAIKQGRKERYCKQCNATI